jgi:serine/threonine protein kinase
VSPEASPPAALSAPEALLDTTLGGWSLSQVDRIGARLVSYLAAASHEDGGRATVLVSRDGAEGLAELIRTEAALRRVHPTENVIGLLDAGLEERPHPWVALERLDGTDLHTALGQGSLDLRRALEISVGILRGLVALHAAGVTHGGLRASAVGIAADGTVRLLRLEQARLTDLPDPPSDDAPPSPEGHRREPWTSATDLYAFGTLLFRMLTGRPALSGETTAAALRAHGEDPPPHASDLAADLPARLDVLVHRLLSKVPSARPTADAALAVVAELRATHPDLADETDPTLGPPVELRPGDDLNGYILERELGRGGAGVTYAGRDREGVLYALKVARLGTSADKAREQLRRDAEHAAQVRPHPSVARVYGVGEGEVQGVPVVYLRSELVEGPSLARLIDQHGALPIAAVLHLFARVAQGLTAIHAAGVLHLDLKPSNILLDRPVDPTRRLEAQLLQTTPKIIDFGISRRASEATTSTGVEGTPYYMSPEQCEGMIPAPTADLYALGAAFFHVATGAPAFTGEQLAVLHKQVNQPAPLAQLEGRLGFHLSLIIARCMLKDPDQRYPTAEALLEDMARAGGRDFPSRELESARDRELLLLTGQTRRRAPPASEGFKRHALVFAPLARLLGFLARPQLDRQAVERGVGWLELRLDELRDQLLERPSVSEVELEVVALVLLPRLRRGVEALDDPEGTAALLNRLERVAADLRFLSLAARVHTQTAEERWGGAEEALEQLPSIGDTQARNRLVRVRIERDLRERLDEVRWDLEEVRAKAESLLDADERAWAKQEVDGFLRRHPSAPELEGVEETLAALRDRLDAAETG